MNTDYQIYINYDDDSQVYCLPVNPETIKLTYKGQTTSADIDKFGEVLHKSKRDAAVISFESFFPAAYNQNICVCSEGQFRKPADWIKWIKSLEEKDKPAHFVLTGSPLNLNLYADITNFVPEEAGGDPGTIQYSIELKESRTPQVGKYVNQTAAKSSGAKRNSNKENPGTYTVKKGDCLWNIAKKYYGKGADYSKIYNANKDKVKNPNRIYPGQVLTIP